MCASKFQGDDSYLLTNMTSDIKSNLTRYKLSPYKVPYTWYIWHGYNLAVWRIK